MEAMKRNTRDKLIIGAMIIFGVLSFVGMFLDKPMESIALLVINGLFTAYKGNPSQPPVVEEKKEPPKEPAA